MKILSAHRSVFVWASNFKHICGESRLRVHESKVCPDHFVMHLLISSSNLLSSFGSLDLCFSPVFQLAWPFCPTWFAWPTWLFLRLARVIQYAYLAHLTSLPNRIYHWRMRWAWKKNCLNGVRDNNFMKIDTLGLFF